MVRFVVNPPLPPLQCWILGLMAVLRKQAFILHARTLTNQIYFNIELGGKGVRGLVHDFSTGFIFARTGTPLNQQI